MPCGSNSKYSLDLGALSPKEPILKIIILYVLDDVICLFNASNGAKGKQVLAKYVSSLKQYMFHCVKS